MGDEVAEGGIIPSNLGLYPISYKKYTRIFKHRSGRYAF